MVKRSSVVAVLILGLLGGCHQRRSSELDPRIPAANPDRYEAYAKDWRNPFLLIVRDGLRLKSSAIEGGEKTITLDELRDSLKALPVSAWPYGRVVGYSENAIRSGDDDQFIRRNWGKMLEILEAMDIDAYGGYWILADTGTPDSRRRSYIRNAGTPMAILFPGGTNDQEKNTHIGASRCRRDSSPS